MGGFVTLEVSQVMYDVDDLSAWSHLRTVSTTLEVSPIYVTSEQTCTVETSTPTSATWVAVLFT
jgi:hypothetical protein